MNLLLLLLMLLLVSVVEIYAVIDKCFATSPITGTPLPYSCSFVVGGLLLLL